jgi:hypothetical protein
MACSGLEINRTLQSLCNHGMKVVAVVFLGDSVEGGADLLVHYESHASGHRPTLVDAMCLPVCWLGRVKAMSLQLAPEEPEATPWRVEQLSAVVDAVMRTTPDNAVPGRSVVLAVDGRSNNGKTTLAARIGDAVPGSVVIHTDDLAWKHSRFGWTDLLVDGILVPVNMGRAVSYRPPRWTEYGRGGSIEVAAGCPLLVIEGDGAGRREVVHLIDTLIWVQADQRVADRRRRARDRSPGALDMTNLPSDGSLPDHEGWMAEEVPFNAGQRSWERADIVVCGTPEIPYDTEREIVIGPPPKAARR